MKRPLTYGCLDRWKKALSLEGVSENGTGTPGRRRRRPGPNTPGSDRGVTRYISRGRKHNSRQQKPSFSVANLNYATGAENAKPSQALYPSMVRGKLGRSLFRRKRSPFDHRGAELPRSVSRLLAMASALASESL